MTTNLRDALTNERQRQILASVDSAAREVAVEDRHQDIHRAIDRMPPDARQWALANTNQFCDLVEFYRTEAWRDLKGAPQ